MRTFFFFFKRNSDKIIFCFFSFVFFVTASYFNIERLYGDSAAYLFSIVNSENFQIAHLRPVSLLIEILPVTLIKYNFGLQSVILSFSINEWLYVFLSCVILRMLSGVWTFSFAILFSLLIGVRYNYFNPVSELILGTPFLFLLYFILVGNSKLLPKLICFVFTALFLVFSHPIYCLIIPFLMVLNYYETYKEKKREVLLASIACIGLLTLRYFLSGNYDSDPLKEVGNPEQRGLPYLLKFNYARMIFTIVPVYLGSFILFGVAVYRLIKNAKKIQAGILIVFAAAYFFLVMYKFARFFPDTYEPFERYLYPIPLVICLVYFLYCYKKTFPEHLMLLLIAIYHFALIFAHGKFVKERYTFLSNAITNCDQFKGNKFAYRKENYFPITKGHDWIMSSESMLISAARGSDKVKQIIVKEFYDQNTLNTLNENEFIYFPYPMWKKETGQLNADYFNMLPSPLIYVNTDAEQSNQPDSFFVNISIKTGGPLSLNKGQELLVPITIQNENCVPLYSGLDKEKVYISYHWLKDGKITEWDGLRTPIMCDVKSIIFQFMKLKAPSHTGNYQLQADMVFEGKKWAGVTSGISRMYQIN